MLPRPLETVEILDAALVLARQNWSRYLALSATGGLPLVLLVLGYRWWLGRLTVEHAQSYFWLGTLAWALLMTGAWLLHGLGRGALTVAVLRHSRGEPVTFRESWREALRSRGTLFFLAALVESGVGWLSSCFLMPAVWAISGWMIARPVALDEGQPYTSALHRSSALLGPYRGKAISIWSLFVILYLLAGLNLFFLVQYSLLALQTLLGLDLSATLQTVDAGNYPYLLFVGLLLFMLLDPLKTCADVVLYHDVRIRREGADLEQRLRSFRTAVGGLLLAALLALPGRASGMPVDEYAGELARARQALQKARTPADVDPSAFGRLGGKVELPDGRTVEADNGGLRRELGSWSTDAERQQLVRRLEAIQRSLGPREGLTSPPRSPREVLKSVAAKPEFQELQAREEIDRAIDAATTRPAQTFWERVSQFFRSIGDGINAWLRRLFRPRPGPRPRPNRNSDWSLPPGFLEYVLYGLLILAASFIIALLVKLYLSRPRGEQRAARAASSAGDLPDATTENALEHTVDEWETFAAEWRKRGDFRQAVRALYLATLVQLHRDRRIDYDRTCTNWHYVRHYRGQTVEREVLRRLTHAFDRIWYGNWPCQEDHYQQFEGGARQLIATPNVQGAARG